MREGLPFSLELCWVLICISPQLGEGCLKVGGLLLDLDSSSFADETLQLGTNWLGERSRVLAGLSAFDK